MQGRGCGKGTVKKKKVGTEGWEKSGLSNHCWTPCGVCRGIRNRNRRSAPPFPPRRQRRSRAPPTIGPPSGTDRVTLSDEVDVKNRTWNRSTGKLYLSTYYLISATPPQPTLSTYYVISATPPLPTLPPQPTTSEEREGKGDGVRKGVQGREREVGR